MNPLDEIQARTDGERTCQQPGCEQRDCHTGKDRAKLLAAVRAVERLAKHIDETHAELPLPHGPLTNGYAMAIRDVRAAIREALA